MDELFLLRFLADDPALPECLGGTVISPWQDALMVREVEHAVKGKQEAHAWLDLALQRLPIFKSLHNYHYGTFVKTVRGVNRDSKQTQKYA